jgi:hypothetical protein
MPRTTCEVFIEVKIAVCDDVESSALLIADDDRQGILKFLPETDIEHAGIERPHILTSNQRGMGNDPVTVLGRIRSAVA